MLHYACDRGQLEVVKLLVDRGANVNALVSKVLTTLERDICTMLILISRQMKTRRRCIMVCVALDT
jgi:ankyrin repeat protein